MTGTQAQIEEALSRARGRGEVGVQVAAYVDGELVVDAWTGDDAGSPPAPIDGDTLFPAFSVTKAVTVTALHLQAERGLIQYDDPIAKYWPEYGVNGKSATTVGDLLTHRTGAPQMPVGVDAEKMGDWDWMVAALAQEEPIFPPGTVNAYHSISWGWLVGELVLRTDGGDRTFGTFVRQEICEPLGITDLYIGLPESEFGRVATLINELTIPPGADAEGVEMRKRTMPPAVAPIPEVFGLPEVWKAEIPGAGGIMSARAGARFFAMLAGGGELDGVRLLSEERLRSMLTPRPDAETIDRVSSRPRYVGIGGYWLGGESPPADLLYGPSHAVLGHTGAGGANGWADLDARLGITICHNRMFNSDIAGPDDHPFIPLAEAIREVASAASSPARSES